MKQMLKIAAAAALFTAAPAMAAPVTINFSGHSGILGVGGNARTFSGTDGTTTVNVRATGWSWDGSRVRDSFLGAYGAGLGVTSGDELGFGNTHVVDNQNRVDFILLQFDQAVQLTSAVFNTFSLGRGTDSDATIGWGTLGGIWNQSLTFNNTNGKALSKLFEGTADALGDATSGSRAFNLTNASGNFWLIGANFANADHKIDGFKLGGVTLKTVAPVPEPSTWAMMLAGFALVAVAMRNAIRKSEQRFTDKVRRIATSG